jgi:hypothetical protein
MGFGIKLIDGISQANDQEFKLLAGKDVDLTEADDFGGNLADADLILVDDAAAGTQASTKKSAMSRVWTYIQAKIAAAVDIIDSDQIVDNAVTEDKLADALLAEINANTSKLTNVTTNLDITGTTGARTITSSDGTSAVIPVATASVGGVMSSTIFDEHVVNTAKTGITSDQASAITANTAKVGITTQQASDITANNAKISYNSTASTKLATIETSATADQTDAEIRAAIDAATDSNVFTDADHTKLNAIEALADVTDATNVEAAGALMDSEVEDLAGVKGVTISTLQVKPSEGAFVDGDKTKLDAIEASATADQTAAEIRTLVGTGNSNFVPAEGTEGHFLKHDGTFGLPSYTTNTDTTYSVGDGGLTEINFTTADNTKLDGIEAGAEVNVVDSVAGKTGVVTLLKGDVGLGNVTNESKATMFASPTFTGTVGGVTKGHVGLGSVDNTADSTKPVSTAQANSQLDLKANISLTNFYRSASSTNCISQHKHNTSCNNCLCSN